MKKIIISSVITCLLFAGLVWADGALQTAGTVPIQGFAPNLGTSIIGTKTATYTIPSKSVAVRFRCVNDCTVAINGTGVAFPIDSKTPETFIVGAGVKTLVFAQSSSAQGTIANILRH